MTLLTFVHIVNANLRRAIDRDTEVKPMFIDVTHII